MYRNHEGYADPTAGAAIAHITRDERREKRMLHAAETHPVNTHPKTTRRKKSKRRYNERAENAKWIKAIIRAQNQIRNQETENEL